MKMVTDYVTIIVEISLDTMRSHQVLMRSQNENGLLSQLRSHENQFLGKTNYVYCVKFSMHDIFRFEKFVKV